MSEFEQMLEESFKTIKTGEVVNGTVIALRENDVVVNIGYKHDGLIQISEFETAPEAGAEIQARVVKINDGDGNVILTTKRQGGRFAEKQSQVLQDAFDQKTVLTATVEAAVKGGLSVIVDDVKVFIPSSMVSDRFEKDQSVYEGKEISFVITEYNPKKHRVIGDRKQVILAEKAEALKNVLENIHEGDIVEGTVKNVTDFGAFIDLGGADGLLHISEMSWGRITSPKKLYKSGDTVRAFVKSIDGSKIALSVKFPDENPWADAEEKFAVGTVVTGTVARLTDFGAFVELAKGVDGLLHVSQITQERIEKPSDVLTQGQEITAKITGLDLENKKISLSVRALLPKPERPDRSDRPRRNRAPREESYTDENGVVNVEAFLKKEAAKEAAMAAKEEAKKAEEAQAEEAKAPAEAVPEVVEEAKAPAEEAAVEAPEVSEEKTEEKTEE